MNTLYEAQSIASQIKRGDVAAFEVLFKENYKKLCCYAEDFMKEKAAAEEIVGDFFLKLWENRESLDIKESINAYMYTSIRNNCLKSLEHLKVLQKYRDYATYTLQNADLLYPTSYPLNDMISNEIVSEVEEAIDSLPEQCREVFNLSRFEELSYQEIANKLDLSINTVRTQMTRAMQKLREKLKKYIPILLIPFVISVLAKIFTK